jgi:superfamily II DNA or RNA helicase
LDEGFDIPSCRTAFILASSNSYRQYVQRRGRVLRRATGKSHAEIVDLAAIPSPALLKRNASIWRRQVGSELTRIRDFVALASNANEQQYDINKKMEQLGLGAIYYDEAPISEENGYGD